MEMRYIAASQRWLSDYGLAGSPVGRLHYDVFPEISQDWKAVHRRCLAGASESSEGEPFLRADGRVQWVKWSAWPWRGRGGEVGGVILTSEDITIRKEAETMAAHLASVVTHSSDAIIAKTLDSIVTSWNAGATRLLGYRAEEMIGQPIARIIPPERAGEEEQILERLRASETVDYFETQRVAKDGRVLDVSLSISPVTNALGEIVGASKIIRDVTARKRAERELAATAAILATEHESSPDGILVVDPTARILSVNRRFGEMFGVPYELLPTLDYAALNSLALRRLTDGEAFLRSARYLYDHPDESDHDELVLRDGRIVDSLASPFKASDGECLGRIWFFRDITERRRAEEALRDSEERFRTLIEEAPDAIMIVDFDRIRLIAANKAAERLLGLSRDEILRRDPRSFYPPEQPDGRPAAESFAEHGECAAAGEEVTFERRIRRPSGEDRLCRVTAVRLASSMRLLRVSLVDITEQRAAEAQLSEVLRGMVALQEVERQRIARELHDSFNQYLAALNMKLEMFGRSVPDSSPLTSSVAELKGLTVALEDEVSRLAWELRPIALDDIGLEPAIERLAEELSLRTKVRIDLDLTLYRRRLPPDVETTLYRVLQEGVMNVVKHAGASRIGVIVRTSPDDVVMMIEDDGKGFDPEAVIRGASPRFGLLGMRERLAIVHGSLEIESGPGAGTTLIVRAPLKDPAASSF